MSAVGGIADVHAGNQSRRLLTQSRHSNLAIQKIKLWPSMRNVTPVRVMELAGTPGVHIKHLLSPTKISKLPFPETIAYRNMYRSILLFQMS